MGIAKGVFNMKYDFTTILDRHDQDAIAIDAIGADVPWGQAPSAPQEGYSSIPMWVADMNFATAPTIQEAIIRRVQHPAFGYFSPRDEYYDAIIRWHTERNRVKL